MRRFFACAAILAAGAAFAADVRVGVIGLDTSHAIAFTKLINVEKDPACAGFAVTVAYQWGSRDIASSTNRYAKYVPQMRDMGVNIVPSIADVLAESDVVLLETNDGREHFSQAKEVFASGKLCFIDKPIAHNLADALKIYNLGKATGAKYFSSSALRYSDVAVKARAGEYGKIRSAAITSPSPEEKQGTHNYYTWYGIHGFEPLVAIMGRGVEKVSCFRTANDDVVNAVWADGRLGQLHLLRPYGGYSGYVMPEKPANPKEPVVLFGGYQGYQPLLKEILKFFRTGEPPIPPEETLEIMAFMEAAELSANRGGAPVTIAEVMTAAKTLAR